MASSNPYLDLVPGNAGPTSAPTDNPYMKLLEPEAAPVQSAVKKIVPDADLMRPVKWTEAYDQVIEAASKMYPNVTPELLHGILATETSGDVAAKNKQSGALGLGQFLGSTAEQAAIGPSKTTLKGNGYDLRTNPIDSIWATARYMHDLIDSQHGDQATKVMKAVAGYGGVVSADPGHSTYYRSVMLAAHRWGFDHEPYKMTMPVEIGKQVTGGQVDTLPGAQYTPAPKLTARQQKAQQLLAPSPMAQGIHDPQQKLLDILAQTKAVFEAFKTTATLQNLAIGTGGAIGNIEKGIGEVVLPKTAGFAFDLAQRSAEAGLHRHEHGYAGLQGLGQGVFDALGAEGEHQLQRVGLTKSSQLQNQFNEKMGFNVLMHGETPKEFQDDADAAVNEIRHASFIGGKPGDPYQNIKDDTIVNQFGAEMAVMALYDPSIILGSLGVYEKIGVLAEEGTLPTLLAAHKAGTMKASDAAAFIAGKLARMKGSKDPDWSIGYGKVRPPAPPGMPEDFIEGEFKDVSGETLPSNIKPLPGPGTLAKRQLALPSGELPKGPTKTVNIINMKARRIAQAEQRARDSVEGMSDWLYKTVTRVHDQLGVYSNTKRWLAARYGTKWVQIFSELMMSKGANRNLAAFGTGVVEKDLIGEEADEAGLAGAFTGMEEHDKLHFLDQLNGPRDVNSFTHAEGNVNPGNIPRWHKVELMRDSLAYLMGDDELRAWLVHEKGFQLPTSYQQFERGAARGLMSMDDYRQNYITIPHDQNIPFRRYIEDLYAQSTGKWRSFTELKKWDPYLEDRPDIMNLPYHSDIYINAMRQRGKVAFQAMAAHDMQATAHMIAKKHGFEDLVDWHSPEGHAVRDMFEFQKVTPEDNVQWARDLTDWGKVPLFYSPLPHMANIGYLTAMTHPSVLISAIPKFTRLMKTPDPVKRLQMFRRYVDAGIVGPTQGKTDWLTGSENIERGGSSFMKTLDDIAYKRFAMAIKPTIHDGKIVIEDVKPLKAVAWMFHQSQATLWNWDEAMKMGFYDLELQKWQNPSRASYETMAALVDYSNRSKIADSVSAVVPFATWQTKMPLAFMRQAIRHPEIIATMMRADPMQGGLTSKESQSAIAGGGIGVMGQTQMLQGIGNAMHASPELVKSMVGQDIRSVGPGGELSHILTNPSAFLGRTILSSWVRGLVGTLNMLGILPAWSPNDYKGREPWITYGVDAPLYGGLMNSGLMPMMSGLFNIGLFQGQNRPAHSIQDVGYQLIVQQAMLGNRTVPAFEPTDRAAKIAQWVREHKSNYEIDQLLKKEKQGLGGFGGLGGIGGGP